MYEKSDEPLLPKPQFLKRLGQNLSFGLIFMAVSLSIGMLGYHYFEKMSWSDAFVNAAMILSGMGPVSTLDNDSAKIFAGCYALFSGIAFILASGIIFAPLIHRFFHKFHLDTEDEPSDEK
jgi:hypothetical protein